MTWFKDLFDLAAGESPKDEGHPNRRYELVLRALLTSLCFAAFYGALAGSTDWVLALGNLYKLPMVLLLSALCALPAGLLTWKLLGAPSRASDLLVGMASGNFTAAMVLAALAPLVALYYHTSSWLGGALALCAAALATVLGLFNVARAVLNRAPKNAPVLTTLLPLGVLMLVHLASLVQFVHVASPILPELTVFDGGADAILGG